MSGEMIAIVAVGVALAGCGKTWRGWNRGWMRGSTVWMKRMKILATLLATIAFALPAAAQYERQNNLC